MRCYNMLYGVHDMHNIASGERNILFKSGHSHEHIYK